MTVEEIRKKLGDRVIRVVAERSGVNYQTVRNIAIGRTKNPKHKDIIKLTAYLTE